MIFVAIRDVDNNQQEIAYRRSKAHPGVVYFPWQPLSTLLGEGRLYHFEWGAYDHYVAKNRNRVPVPSRQQIIAHIPDSSKLQFIAYGPLHQEEFSVLGYPLEGRPRGTEQVNSYIWFPDARRRVAVTELPDFVVYTQ